MRDLLTAVALLMAMGTCATLAAEAGAGPREGSPPAGSYDPGGRRDPFADPRRGGPGPQTRCRCSGPSGFLIQEMALRGIVKTPTGHTALFQGPDGKTYFLTGGERVYDGALLSVGLSAVVFRQDVIDPLGPPRARDVTIALHPQSAAPR